MQFGRINYFFITKGKKERKTVFLVLRALIIFSLILVLLQSKFLKHAIFNEFTSVPLLADLDAHSFHPSKSGLSDLCRFFYLCRMLPIVFMFSDCDYEQIRLDMDTRLHLRIVT